MQARGTWSMPAVVFSAVLISLLLPPPVCADEKFTPEAIDRAVLLSAGEPVEAFGCYHPLVMISARLTGKRLIPL